MILVLMGGRLVFLLLATLPLELVPRVLDRASSADHINSVAQSDSLDHGPANELRSRFLHNLLHFAHSLVRHIRKHG